ncbi:hypothetical protein [Merismopedia glauca]|nr:hypothetical protein [Merismopedia glauca]
MVQYSRVKRWLNMHGKEFNPDGTLKAEVRANNLAQGDNPLAIDSYEARLKKQFEEWKHLDETDPEPWVDYTAYDFFTAEEKEQFHPDGTLKREYIEYATSIGITESALARMEYKKRNEVASYNRISAYNKERGINFGANKMRGLQEDARRYNQNVQQMKKDLRNGEEVSSLPFDPDHFYHG